LLSAISNWLMAHLLLSRPHRGLQNLRFPDYGIGDFDVLA
jgi:hypothetical protein